MNLRAPEPLFDLPRLVVRVEARVSCPRCGADLGAAQEIDAELLGWSTRPARPNVAEMAAAARELHRSFDEVAGLALSAIGAHLCPPPVLTWAPSPLFGPFGVWVEWDEYTDNGRVMRAGGQWMTEGAAAGDRRHEPALFACRVGAERAAAAWEVERRGWQARPEHVRTSTRRYGPTATWEKRGCADPDLSGLGGWLP